jgi:hypothetical protein
MCHGALFAPHRHGVALFHGVNGFRRAPWVSRSHAESAVARTVPLYDRGMCPQFAFRTRAHAAAHFNFGDGLTFRWPGAVAVLQSEYTGGEDGRAYPVTIHGEIRGEAQSIEEAQAKLSSMIGNVFPLIALAANAAVADPLAICAHGVDLAAGAQPFIGYRTPRANSWFPSGRRKIDSEATEALAIAVGHHPHGDLLHRSIESYRRAVGHWFPEEQLLAGEYLFIAAEALSRFLIESRAAEQGITPKNLVRLSDAANSDQLRWRYLHDDVFDGDTAAVEALKAASDGFEHGYMTFDEIRRHQQPVLERAFRHVRRALIVATQLPEPYAERLLAETYEEPRALVPVVVVVTGELAVTDPTKPALEIDGGAIELEWSDIDPVAIRRPDGSIGITVEPRAAVTALPENAHLTLSGFGMRAAHLSASNQPLEVKVERTQHS